MSEQELTKAFQNEYDSFILNIKSQITDGDISVDIDDIDTTFEEWINQKALDFSCSIRWEDTKEELEKLMVSNESEEDRKTREMKEIYLFESCLEDLLQQFVRQQIDKKAECDCFFEVSDLDFEAEYSEWLNQKITDFIQNVDWEEITNLVLDAT